MSTIARIAFLTLFPLTKCIVMLPVFLVRNSKSVNSFIERTSVRGVYRLNQSNTDRQLQFDFRDGNMENEGGDEVCEDKSLSLF